jgi:flagellar biosynthesis chaperone FliJ
MQEANRQRSEVARILEQISQEYEAAKNGLTGLASGTARHEFISKRMENMQQLHSQLREIVGDEATAMVAEQLQSLPDNPPPEPHRNG